MVKKKKNLVTKIGGAIKKAQKSFQATKIGGALKQAKQYTDKVVAGEAMSLWRGAGKIAAAPAKAITGAKQVKGAEKVFGGSVDVKGGLKGYAKDPDVQNLAITTALSGVGRLVGKAAKGGAKAVSKTGIGKIGQKVGQKLGIGRRKLLTGNQQRDMIRNALTGGRFTGKGIPNLAERGVEKSAQRIMQQRARIAQVAQRLGVDAKTLSAAERKIALEGMEATGMFGKAYQFAKQHKVLTAAGGLIGTNMMATWIASDNVLSGTTMTANSIVEGVKSGVITPEQAQDQMAELEQTRTYAERFVKISVKLNPLLWLVGKPFLVNAETAKRQLELKRQLLEATPFNLYNRNTERNRPLTAEEKARSAEAQRFNMASEPSPNQGGG